MLQSNQLEEGKAWFMRLNQMLQLFLDALHSAHPSWRVILVPVNKIFCPRPNIQSGDCVLIVVWNHTLTPLYPKFDQNSGMQVYDQANFQLQNISQDRSRDYVSHATEKDYEYLPFLIKHMTTIISRA